MFVFARAEQTSAMTPLERILAMKEALLERQSAVANCQPGDTAYEELQANDGEYSAVGQQDQFECVKDEETLLADEETLAVQIASTVAELALPCKIDSDDDHKDEDSGESIEMPTAAVIPVQQEVEKDQSCLYAGDLFLLWFLGGFFGIHHFALKRWFHGIAYLLTFGLFGIGWIYDGFRLYRLKPYRDGSRHTETTLSEAYVFLAVAGLFGWHWLYLGNTRRFLLCFFTLNFLGTGWLIDWCRLPSAYRITKSS